MGEESDGENLAHFSTKVIIQDLSCKEILESPK